MSNTKTDNTLLDHDPRACIDCLAINAIAHKTLAVVVTKREWRGGDVDYDTYRIELAGDKQLVMDALDVLRAHVRTLPGMERFGPDGNLDTFKPQ